MGCFPRKAVLLTVFARILESLPLGTITLAKLALGAGPYSFADGHIPSTRT